jgi:hypothetical protein
MIVMLMRRFNGWMESLINDWNAAMDFYLNGGVFFTKG